MATATTATMSDMSTMRILFFDDVLGSCSLFVWLSFVEGVVDVAVVEVVGAAAEEEVEVVGVLSS